MIQIYGAPPSGDAFHDRRRTCLGGSDAGAILGVSPFASRLSVWEEKRGLAPVKLSTERMLWGQRLEGAVIAGYAEDHGRKVRRGGRRFRRHPVYPFIGGHPDGVTDDDRLVEVKTTARLDERYGEDGSDRVPAHFYAQCQHYLILRSLPVADLVVLVAGREPHVFTIPADDAFQSALIDEERLFWESVVEGVPPDPDGSDSAGETLRRLFPWSVPEEIVASPAIAEIGERFLVADEELKRAKRERERLAQLMQSFMGSRERLLAPSFRASWGTQKGHVSWEKVARSLAGEIARAEGIPEDVVDEILAAEAEKHRGDPFRRFLVTETRREDS